MLNSLILKHIDKNGIQCKINCHIGFNESNSCFVFVGRKYKATSHFHFSFKLLNTYFLVHRNLSSIPKDSLSKLSNTKTYQCSRRDNNLTTKKNKLEKGIKDIVFYSDTKGLKNLIEETSYDINDPLAILNQKMKKEKEDCTQNKRILTKLKYQYSLNFYNCMNSNLHHKNKNDVKHFSSLNVSLINEKKIKFSKLKLTDVLDIINKCLTSVELKTGSFEQKNENIWEKIFTQIEKITSKEVNNEEYKREICFFLQNLTNMDLYHLLYNLKEVNGLVKSEVYEGLFFECFTISIRKRDITYPFQKEEYTNDYRTKNEENKEENKSRLEGGESTILERKEMKINKTKKNNKIKSYFTNIKDFLSKNKKREHYLDGEKEDDKQNGNKDEKMTNENDMIKKEEKDETEKLKTQEKEEKEKKEETEETEEIYEIEKLKAKETEEKEETEKLKAKRNELLKHLQQNDRYSNGKNVKLIRKWLYLVSYFPNNSSNFLIIKDYLNKMFRKNIDELIEINYFANTIDCLTNQINNKSIQAIIMAYENKLSLMKSYDFSYSLIILSRFLILSYKLFNKIIDASVVDPVQKFKNEKNFIRFIKSIDNYPLVNISPSENQNDVSSFQNNMNDLYNLTFAIFLKKLSFKLKYYSLNNLLYISECLSKVIFIPSAQNHTLCVFINKLRYFIDQSVDLLFVNNYTLVRLFKISSSFAFIPESYVFLTNNVRRGGNISRNCIKRHSLPTIDRMDDKLIDDEYKHLEKRSDNFSCENVIENIADEINYKKGNDQRNKTIINLTEKKSLEENDPEKKKEKKKKNISFKLNEEHNEKCYEKGERNVNERDVNEKLEEKKSQIKYVSENPIFSKYDTMQVYNNTFQYNDRFFYNNNNNNKRIRNNTTNLDSVKSNEKNKFLLKNIVILLCAKFEKTIDEILTKEIAITSGDANENKEKKNLTKEILINEIKLINETNKYPIDFKGLMEKNMAYYNKDSKLYKDYLIFYDLNMLCEIIKFTSASINTNKYTYELIKPIKKRLKEIFSIYTINQTKYYFNNGEKKLINEEDKKIQNINTFQLYKMYCAVKNLSPSYFLSFFDILIKLTPKLSVIDIEKNVDILNEKNFYKSDKFKQFEKVYNEHISVPFVVSLLQALKIVISSNLFESSNAILNYVDIVIQYSYYVLFYYYYNQGLKKKKKKKEKMDAIDDVINEEEKKEEEEEEEEEEKEKEKEKERERKGEEDIKHVNNYKYGNTNFFLKKENLEKREIKTIENEEELKKEEKSFKETGKREDMSEMKNIISGQQIDINKQKEYWQEKRIIDKEEKMHTDATSVDDISVKNLIKKKKINKNFCLFEKLYQNDVCNIYVCLSTILYFINRNENKSNEVKHLIYLEDAYLNLLSELKLLKYLSDKDIFFLFKSPLTKKLEEKLDAIIPFLKNANQKKMKRKTTDLFSSSASSPASSNHQQLLSLPSLTAFFLCKAKLSISCTNENNNGERIEKTLKLCEILISEYKLLSSCIVELFHLKENNYNTEDSNNINTTKKNVEKMENDKMKNYYQQKNESTTKSGDESQTFSNSFLNKFQKIKKKYSHMTYFISNKNNADDPNKNDIKKNMHFKKMINNMFFGSHEIETLYDLQDCLLKTIKDIKMAQINFTLNHKFINILPVHNDILAYLTELFDVIRECLYIIFLSQPYVHKNSKEYCTKKLVNYYINKCKLIDDENTCDEYQNKHGNELKVHKFITSIM